MPGPDLSPGWPRLAGSSQYSFIRWRPAQIIALRASLVMTWWSAGWTMKMW